LKVDNPKVWKSISFPENRKSINLPVTKKILVPSVPFITRFPLGHSSPNVSFSLLGEEGEKRRERERRGRNEGG
jgi:hypothetical protein